MELPPRSRICLINKSKRFNGLFTMIGESVASGPIVEFGLVLWHMRRSEVGEKSKMRSAYSSSAGYHSHGSPYDSGHSGYDQGADRLSNIKRSIDAIEQRLMTAAAPVAGYGQPAMPPPQMSHDTPQFSRMLQAHMPQALAPQPPHAAAAQPAPYGAMAAAPQFQAPQAAPMNNPVAEIAQRQQMLNAGVTNQVGQQQHSAQTDGLGRQLEELKNEIAGVKSQVAKPIAVQQSVPQQEIDRIAKAIAELQAETNSGDQTIDRLTQELDQLRNAMRGDLRSAMQKGIKANVESQTEHLAKQLNALGKDVRSAIRAEVTGKGEQQAQELTRRLDELSRDINQISVQSINAVAPRVDSLSAQLDSLRMTIDDLPQTLAISRIEDRLGELTDRVSSLAKSEVAPSNDAPAAHVTLEEFVSLEKRLDEIARALVAVSNSGRNAPQVDMSAVERVEARMSELARTLDTVAERADNRDSENLEKLAVRIDGLTERLGSFEKYAQSSDLGGASAPFASSETGVIEDQLRNLSSRLDEVAAQTGTQSLEQQIQQLSQRVEEASNMHSTSAQMSSLEAQIGQILQQMGGIDGAGGVDFAPVEARLGQIEYQLQANQNFSLEAAQQAAQHAVAMMGPQSEAGGIVDALAHDLKSLQVLAEGNATQSNQSVQQIQQTLQQVVDRLGTIEGTLEGETVRQATMMAVGLAMPAAPDLPDPEPVAGTAGQNASMMSSDGLVDAAIADENLGVIHKAALDVGFVDPQGEGQPNGADSPAPTSMPSAVENMPLEPGSAAPNLDEMVQRASQQLNETHSKLTAAGDDMTGEASGGGNVDNLPDDERASADLRPDAVAAARRALQATTAEMTAVRNEAGGEDSEKSTQSAKSKLLNSFSNFDSSRLRKPLVLGAVALLLAIVTFKSIGLFTGSNDKPVAKLDAPAVEMSADSAGDKTINGTDTLTAADRVATDRSVRTVGTSNSETESAPPAQAPKMMETAEADTPTVAAPDAAAQPANIPVDDDTSVSEPIVETPSMADTEPVEQTEPLAKAEPEPSTEAIYDVSPNAGPAALVAAASAGDPKALFQVGMRYSDGDDVQRNMTEAANWFQRAAEVGFAPAQYLIGSLYEKGIGVERDVVKATGWYEKAARQGNARAIHNLAVIYVMGNPPAVQPNMDTAVEWFHKAARLGIKDSQFNLGILYGQGMGVPQNLVDSYKWFALAAKTGDSDASKKRDEVANAMDPDDLDYARKEVNNWAPSKLKETVNRVAVPEEWRGPSASQKSAAKPSQQNASIMKVQDMLNQ